MKRFLDLQEAPKTVAFTFGRFNPPTIGHEKLCDAVRRANPSDYKIYASQSQNPKKDPLQYVKKIAYMRQSFPKHKRNIIKNISKFKKIKITKIGYIKKNNSKSNVLSKSGSKISFKNKGYFHTFD